jgi:hypothetical protein
VVVEMQQMHILTFVNPLTFKFQFQNVCVLDFLCCFIHTYSLPFEFLVVVFSNILDSPFG